MKKSLLLTLTILAIQTSTAWADKRYDIVCVTSASIPGQVLVYDTLISAYAEKYKYDALTYLREADVFKVNQSLANEASVADIKKNQTYKTAYRNVDFPNSSNEEGHRSVSGARVVIATSQMITITDSENNQVQFKIPFINPDLQAPGEVKGSDLVFNGQTVSSVSYRVCGEGAD